MEATARCLGSSKNEYRDAIEWISKAIDVMPQNMKDGGIAAYLEAYCSDWMRMLGYDDQALEMAEK